MHKQLSAACAAAALSLLAGCGTQPIVADDPRPLQADEGIAAVVLDAPYRIEQVQFAPRFPGGSKFEVPDTQGGAALYLVPVKAGHYCLQHFHYSGTTVNSTEDLGCFTVISGHITYSGDIVPELSNFNQGHDTTVYTRQDYEPTIFRRLLQAGYPKMADAYPIAAPAPVKLQEGAEPPSADAELGFWFEFGRDRAETLEVQNNTSWTIKITHLQLLDCENLAQPCSDMPLNLLLGPFESHEVLTLGPADKDKAYTFRYQYWNEIVQ
jgi:hypothetical protein